MTDPKITKAIKKLASGYSVSEVTEDFAVEDGEFHVVKKRRTKKEIPPRYESDHVPFGERGSIGQERGGIGKRKRDVGESFEGGGKQWMRRKRKDLRKIF